MRSKVAELAVAKKRNDGEIKAVAGFPAGLGPREAAEVSLLATLRGRSAALRDLLATSSDHWGYEDPVYRFYHQSFKVFHLQQQTTAIVAALADLAPDAFFLLVAHDPEGLLPP